MCILISHKKSVENKISNEKLLLWEDMKRRLLHCLLITHRNIVKFRRIPFQGQELIGRENQLKSLKTRITHTQLKLKSNVDSQANFIIGDICILAVWSYACHRKLHVIALLLRSGLGLNSTWIRYNPGLKILSPLMCVALFPVQLRLTRA